MKVESINDGGFFTAVFMADGIEVIKLFANQANNDAHLLIKNDTSSLIYIGPTEDTSPFNGFKVLSGATFELDLPQGSDLYAYVQIRGTINVLATLW